MQKGENYSRGDVMSNVFSSPTDENGSQGNIQIVRTLSDWCDLDLTRGVWKKKRTLSRTVLYRLKPDFVTIPILITAGDSLSMTNENNVGGPLFGVADDGGGGGLGIQNLPMFKTLEMKDGDIQSFSDNGGTLRVNAAGHTLQEDDTVKILDSRVGSYNGNFVVSAVAAGTFDLDSVTYVSDDGPCRYKAVKLSASAATPASNEIVITITNHTFLVDDWINIRDPTNLTNGLNNLSVQITAVTTDTITIGDQGVTFTGPQIVEVDTAEAFFDISRDHMTGTELGVKLMDLQGTTVVDLDNAGGDSKLSAVFFITSTLTNFYLGETRDHSFVGSFAGTIHANCYGWESTNDTTRIMSIATEQNLFYPSTTREYEALWEVGDGDSQTVSFSNMLIEVLDPNQSLVNIPSTVSDAFRSALVSNASPPDPGTFFRPYYKAKVTGDPVVNSPTNVTLPLDDTSRFRVGDTIRLEETSNFDADSDWTLDTINDDVSLVISGGTFPGATGATQVASSTITENGNGTVSIVLDDVNNFAVNDFIKIDNDLNGWNGTYRVLGVLTSPAPILVLYSNLINSAISINADVTSDARPLIVNRTMESLDQKDRKIEATANIGIPSSMAVAQISTEGGTIIIGTEDEWVTTGTLTWTSQSLERFTQDEASPNNGRVTHTGLNNGDFFVTWTVTLEQVGGGTGSLETTVFVNGVEDAVNIIPAKYENTGIVQITGTTISVLNENDTIQIYVRNTDGTQNIEIIQAYLSVVRGG